MEGMMEQVALFEHVKRPQWGLAVCLEEDGDKLAYLFQDGSVRKIHRRFDAMMQRTARIGDDVEAVRTSLLAEAKARIAAAPSRSSSGAKPAVTYPFAEQLAAFKHVYPGGFDDPEWITKVRGDGNAPQKTKRRREGVIALATDILSPEAIAARHSAGDFKGTLDAIVQVAKATRLLKPDDVAAYEKLPEGVHQNFCRAFQDFLDGTGPLKTRFTTMLNIMWRAKSPTKWLATTAIAGYARPNSLIAIRPTSFRVQARSVGANIAIPNAPTGGLYERLVSVSKDVHTRLLAKGEKPRDLFDVYDFIWLTLSPKGQKLIEEVKRGASPMPPIILAGAAEA